MEIYTVQPGDTVYSIARAYSVSEQRIISDNGLEQNGQLTEGQALIILIPEQTYTVKAGDSLYSIAESFGTSVKTLMRYNPWLTSESELLPGREITISFSKMPDSQRRINGYAYPFISQSLLRRELPFLSTLTIFGYGFTPEGTLIVPDDEPLIALAEEFSVAPVLLLSSITGGGNFDSALASTLFNSIPLQNTVLDSLAAAMRQKGYRGLDIDFEYVSPQDASAFADFVGRAAETMHSYGYFVNVDLAPKTSVNQRGLLYEAHDYAALGAAADTVLVMTYEWGYTYGPPMAVAPLDKVTEVINFALTQIPREKIMLGIPNYGYEWTLPFREGVSRAVVLGNQYAVTLAARMGIPIQYDETAQSPWYTYNRSRAEHIVWFEDVRSIQAKFELMTSTNLLGAGYWNLMRPFAQNWALLGVTAVPQSV